MKIELNDNAMYSVIVPTLAVAVCILFANFASCTKASNEGQAKVQAEAVKNGASVTYTGEIISK